MLIFQSILPLAVVLATWFITDRWNKRPAARAKWAKLGLREKIARNLRQLRLAAAVNTGWLALSGTLYAAGAILLAGFLAFTATILVNLAATGYLYALTRKQRRAYDSLGPYRYLAEVQHAFGPVP